MADKNYEDVDKLITRTDNPNQRALLVKKIWVKPGLIINFCDAPNPSSKTFVASPETALLPSTTSTSLSGPS
jgi:hypothetical protein